MSVNSFLALTLRLKGDNGVAITGRRKLQPLENKEAVLDLPCEGLEVEAAEVNILTVTETPEGEDDVFRSPVWYVVGSENVESVEL